MTRKVASLSAAVALVLSCASAAAWAQSSVRYGRITNVAAISQDDARARMGGALVGGTVGAAVGSGRSGSNRILGGVGGAVVGSQVGRLATQRQAFEYTVLIGGQTQRVITDESGLRVGDCVAVETGAFTNLRLVADARCDQPNARASQAEVKQADACMQAKEQLLAASTDADFDRAERRVRLLCAD